jgi:dethiobiotin synthetase
MAKKLKNLYVAATSQHVGKTTSTLGLVSCFLQRGYAVGYCKPVGQKFLDIKDLRVDKDTLLFAELINFHLEPQIHSPVILGSGATTEFLDNPQAFDFHARIENAARELSANNDMVIYEGTGHPGVGSVVNLSNADVAKMLDAQVIVVVEGGVGNTLDRLNLSLSLFREKKVPLLGVIVNKVRPDKLEKVQYYVGKKLQEMQLPLLGVMPYEKSLAYPLIKTISDAIQGFIEHNEHRMGNKVEEIISGSFIDQEKLQQNQNLLLLVSPKGVNDAIRKIDLLTLRSEHKTPSLAGVVVTGEGPINESNLKFLKRHEIPVVRTKLDTYGAALKISRIEVKINLQTPWKVRRAIELIEENVDINQIEQRLTL